MADRRRAKCSGKSNRKNVPTKGIGADQRNAMFIWWVANDHNTLATAKHFGRSNALLHKVRKQDKWDERAAKITDELRDNIDKQIVAKLTSNVELVRLCFLREVRAFLLKPDTKVQGSLQLILDAARYLDEAGGGPRNSADEAATPESVKNALSILGSVSAADRKKLADEITRARKMLGENDK